MIRKILGVVICIFNIGVIIYLINPDIFKNFKITNHDNLFVILIGLIVSIASFYNLFKLFRK